MEDYVKMKYTRYEYESMLQTIRDCYIVSFTDFDKMTIHNRNIDKIREIVREAMRKDGKRETV